ncbi:putative inactive tRNA-specific adenosine deaminase-like protein 3 [Sarcoptes scabiei]|nr:putative inactive tRNA-specific adenosine deaminase-like protein 3 [Sarcoptes scabiei]
MYMMKILIPEIYNNNAIQTKKALILRVIEKKELTKIVQFLNENIPMKQLSLQHLKRIDSSRSNDNRVFICPVDEMTYSQLENFDPIERIVDLIDVKLKKFLLHQGLENLYIADVPISRPLTKNQFLKTSQLWPVCFHEDKYIADCLNGAVFSPVRLENIHQLMDHTLSLLDNQMNGNCSAIITRRNVSEIHKRFKMNPLEKSIGEQSQESTNDDQIYQNDYLCTDYECFLSQEPCLMCAMALIHSRIRRVFFYSSINSEISISCNDKAYSIHQLHFNSKLNHRHEVWQLIKRENHRKLDCDQPSLNNKKKLKFFKN